MIRAIRAGVFAQAARDCNVSLNDALQCVVGSDGEIWMVDDQCEALARFKCCLKSSQGLPAELPPTGGPGTELSRLLKRFGISPTPTCQCRDKAAQMDSWGPEECERPERINEVVAVMRSEAAARGLPFLDAAGKLLVRRAIANARREEARHAKEKARESGSPAV